MGIMLLFLHIKKSKLIFIFRIVITIRGTCPSLIGKSYIILFNLKFQFNVIQMMSLNATCDMAHDQFCCPIEEINHIQIQSNITRCKEIGNCFLRDVLI